ncbi:Signal peptidase subunit 3 [Mycena indigotica]|uniref:Signal peptidase subunit 3 n=1 Tax=Mycena indigotica TaxID=2126181 RepID=A0A8H6WFW0_9AGAR|nr:Signal peptidase subunit 3 [Mycena indigotica]KAF7316172.1 Signal peptidase subunit 3 [Mycena indigotica]
MHTIFARINNISALFSSCVMGLLAAIALSSIFVSYFEAPLEGGSVTVHGVKVKHGKGRQYRFEHAFVDFEIDSDLSPLFNWNTKQLFLYLDAEYTNAKGVKNAVVIWDRIVRRKEDAHIQVKNRQKYQFKDVSGFRDASAIYTLRYNVMPWVGALTYGTAGSTNVTVPFPPMINHS